MGTLAVCRRISPPLSGQNKYKNPMQQWIVVPKVKNLDYLALNYLRYAYYFI